MLHLPLDGRLALVPGLFPSSPLESVNTSTEKGGVQSEGNGWSIGATRNHSTDCTKSISKDRATSSPQTMPLAVAMVVDVERKPPQNLLYVMARGVFELHSPLEPIISWNSRVFY